jgi:lycopene cyclase domain-containing protein
MSLYFWILIGTIAGPFFLSFDKKVHFYKFWKYFLPATFSVAVFFLIWDEYFTQLEIWGFTPRYLQGIYLGNLPLEECLFFILVPYACLFIHEVLKAYFPKITFEKFAHFFAFGFTLLGLILGLMYFKQAYTASACIISALLTIGIYYIKKVLWYGNFVFTFLVAIIPFLIVNGILTGSFTEEPVVWYNENHIIGIRIFTIPMEDLFYNYCMLLPITAIYEWIKKRQSKV